MRLAKLADCRGGDLSGLMGTRFKVTWMEGIRLLATIMARTGWASAPSKQIEFQA